MLSPDLAPDLQYVGTDVPFYDSDGGCKKEMSYYDLQPLTSTQHNTQFGIPTSTSSVLDYIFPQNQNLPDDHSHPWTASWQTKPPVQWSNSDVRDWLFSWSDQTGIDLLDMNMIEFNRMNGQDLCRLSVSEFCTLDPQHGHRLYQSLQSESARYYQPSPISLDISSPLRADNPLPAFHTWSNDSYPQIFVGSDAHGSSPSSSHDSDREDRESTSSSMSTANEKSCPTGSFLSSPDDKKSGRRGRPPKSESTNRSSRSRQGKGNGKLWEFIRDLLLDPATNPSLIRWERPEDGIFKFVQSDQVAKMWGNRKKNPRMTYEKLSRAMRYYYKSQVLLPVFGRRLVYKFGPNATGWRHGPGFH